MLRLANTLVVVCLLAHSQTLSTPKAPAADLLSSVSAETPAANVTTATGDHLLLARYSKPGAAAIRLRIEQIRLPENAVVFVYSLDAGGSVQTIKGPWSGSSDAQTAVLAGDTAYIEVQWGDDTIPGDLPFEVTEVAEAQAEETVETRLVETPEHPLFEGDIVVIPEGVESAKGNRNHSIAITGLSFRWPGGVVP